MKYLFVAFLVLSQAVYSVGQDLPYVGPHQTFIFPNSSNQFLNNGNINWALDTEEYFSFADSKKTRNENIFNYIVAKVFAGDIKAYQFWDDGFVKYENLKDLSDYDILKQKQTVSEEKFIYLDSLKNIKFHSLYYLDNYSLKCKLISAAPLTNFATTSGVSLGLKEIFICCKDTIQNSINAKTYNHLKSIVRTVNFDSIPNSKLAKQTFGLDLVKAMWIGASQGYLNLTDMNSNKIIPTKEVLNYTISDSIEVPISDSFGYTIGYIKKPGYSIFPHGIVNSIQFTQDFYFDTNRNTFFSTIKHIYLFIKEMDQSGKNIILNKRFKIENKNNLN